VGRVHTIIVGLGILLGVALGEVWYIHHGWLLVYLLLTVAIISLIFTRYGRWVELGGWFLVGLLLGNWRFGVVQSIPAADVSRYIDQVVTIQGVVMSDPDVSPTETKFDLQVRSIDTGEIISGKILVKTRRYPTYQYGNLLSVTGKLVSPISDDQSNYARYLGRFGIYTLCDFPEINIVKEFVGQPIWRWLYGVKHYVLQVTQQVMPEPAAGLLAGLLLGVSSALPKNLLDSFNATGLTHIIALSGFNITIVAGAVLSLLRWLPLSIRLTVAIIVIWLFVLLTGGAPSAIRAALMGVLVLVAQLVGRLSDISISVILTAVIMVGLNPKILGSDIGFQLSFLATLGIIYLNPVLQGVGYKLPIFLRQFLLPTLSALILVTPILAVNFGRISLVAPLTNMLVVPLVPLSMLLGFWAVVGGIIQTDLGWASGWIAWVPLRLIVVLTEYFKQFSWSSINVQLAPGGWMLIYYLGVIIWLTIYYVKQIKAPPRLVSITGSR